MDLINWGIWNGYFEKDENGDIIKTKKGVALMDYVNKIGDANLLDDFGNVIHDFELQWDDNHPEDRELIG